MNILSNAVKYNKDNGSICIQCREVPYNQEGMTMIEFICQDTGIGMSREFQKVIFEPFAQENAGSRSKYGGTGLGEVEEYAVSMHDQFAAFFPTTMVAVYDCEADSCKVHKRCHPPAAVTHDKACDKCDNRKLCSQDLER